MRRKHEDESLSHTAWEVGKPTTWVIKGSDNEEMMIERIICSCESRIDKQEAMAVIW
jgi:hypothetical protein